MKKFILMVSAICIFFAGPGISAMAAEQKKTGLAQNAKSAILIERDTGAVLFDKNAHEILPPASMTKLMTMLLIMEALEAGKITKNEKVEISEKAASMGGSQIFLEAGEQMTVNDLLKGIAMASGNDASVAMAEKISGSEEAFVAQMNKKAKKDLGLKNTLFQNTTGLPAENHYSTSYDMAMIAKALLKYEHITKYTSVYEDYLRKGQKNEFWLVNTNKLVRFYDGVDGLKTGFTNEAKFCLTATAKKNDMRVVAVVMGASTTKERNAEVSGLLDYAFNNYETKKIHDKNAVITQLDMFKAKQRTIDVVTSEKIQTIHKKQEKAEKIKTTTKLNEDIQLPIKKGQKIGTLTVKQGDKTLSVTALTVKEDIVEASYLDLLKRTLQKIAK